MHPAAARFEYPFEDEPRGHKCRHRSSHHNDFRLRQKRVTVRPGSVGTGEFMQLHFPSGTASPGLTTSARSSKISKNQGL